MKRDDDSKRYYLYNGLESNLAMEVSEVKLKKDFLK